MVQVRIALPLVLLGLPLCLEATRTSLRGQFQGAGRGDDDYEYGDAASTLGSSDAADYSVNQFLATDDARDGNKDVDDDSKARAQRQAILAREDHFDSEETPDPDSFVQVSKTRRGSDDDYEYGDAAESLGGDADASDYSVNQFLAKDDARDGNSDVDDDSKARAQRQAILAREDHFDSEDTPDPDDSFVQLRSKTNRARSMYEDDDYEYGDAAESLGGDADASDYSVNQFLTKDDARDGNSEVDDDSKARAQRQAILAREDHFDSEDTPDPDASFVQMKSRKVRRSADDDYEYGDAAESLGGDADASDYSVNQFLQKDDARDGNSDVDDDSKARAQRQAILAREDHFDSEDTPDPDDSFVQLRSKTNRRARMADDDDYEYGDSATSLGGDADASDYSVNQFLEKDDARDGNSDVDDDSKARAQRQAILAREDHFDSEDTPDPDDSFVQLKSRKSNRRQKPDDDYEYGDAAASLGGDAAASDYSVNQFLATDDARDGNKDVDDDSKARAQRTAVLAREDHFDSEETPDPDA